MECAFCAIVTAGMPQTKPCATPIAERPAMITPEEAKICDAIVADQDKPTLAQELIKAVNACKSHCEINIVALVMGSGSHMTKPEIESVQAAISARYCQLNANAMPVQKGRWDV
jgi:hypothetical protein